MVRMTRLAAGCFILLLSGALALAESAALTAAQPAVTSTESPELHQFQKIENIWSNAINQRDEYSLELVLSPLFVGVSSSGDLSTRDQQVALLISGDDKTLHLDQTAITVRMMGDIAVVNGTYELRHRDGTAEADEKGIFTHVFERARGVWMCVNSQRTSVPTDSNTKHKKHSNAGTAFHFPLF